MEENRENTKTLEMFDLEMLKLNNYLILHYKEDQSG